MKNMKKFSIFSYLLIAVLLIFTACPDAVDEKEPRRPPSQPYEHDTPPSSDDSYVEPNTLTITGLNSYETRAWGEIGLFQNTDQINLNFDESPFDKTPPEISGYTSHFNYIGVDFGELDDYTPNTAKYNLHKKSNYKNWDGGGLWYVCLIVSIYNGSSEYDYEYYISTSPIDFTTVKDQVINFSELKKFVFQYTAGSIAELKSYNITTAITLDELLLIYNCMTYNQMLENEKLTGQLYKNKGLTSPFSGTDTVSSSTVIYSEFNFMALLKKDLKRITGIISLIDIPVNFPSDAPLDFYYPKVFICIEDKNGDKCGEGDIIWDSGNFSNIRWSIPIYESSLTSDYKDYNIYLKVYCGNGYQALYEWYIVPIKTQKINNSNAYIGNIGTVSLKNILLEGTIKINYSGQPALYFVKIFPKTSKVLTTVTEIYRPSSDTSLGWSLRLSPFSSPTDVSFVVVGYSSVCDPNIGDYEKLFTKEVTGVKVTAYDQNISGISLYVASEFNPENPSPLTPNIWVHDLIERNADVDWYSLEVTKGTTYYFWWNDGYSGDESKTAIINVAEYNSINGKKDLYRSGQSWHNSAVYTADISGTVYIRVSAYSGNTGTYAIVYSTTNSKPAGGNGTYTVSFNSNGGTGTVSSISADSESVIKLPSGGSLSREGYTFGGWTDSAGTIIYPVGASYTVVRNVTLYAKWHPVYTVTFNGNGASGTVPSLEAKNDNNYTVTLPGAGGFSNGDCLFGGWNTKADGTGTNYSAGASYTFNVNITLYAKWYAFGSEENPIPLTGAWMDGSITSPNTAIWYCFNVTSGTKYYVWWNDSLDGDKTKTLNIRVDAKYGSGTTIFTGVDSGWTVPQSFTANSTGIVKLKVVPSSSYNTGTFSIAYSTNSGKPAGNDNTYIVSFDKNGATSGAEPSAIRVVSGSSINLPNNGNLAKTNHTFGGWNTRADGTGTNYLVGASLTVNEYITLYAVWNEIPMGDEARPIPLIESLWKNGVINSSNRELWYSFSVVNGATYYVWWNDSADGDSTKTLDVKVDAKYSDGTAIFTGVDSGWTSPQSFTANSTGTVKLKAASSSGTGTFAIEYNSRNNRTHYNTLTADLWTYVDYGEKWFKFTATASNQYIHVLFGGDDNSVSIYLYDSNNVLKNDLLYDPTNKMSFNLTVGQEYYLRVATGYFYNQILLNSSSSAAAVLPPNIEKLVSEIWTSNYSGEKWFKFTANAANQYIHIYFASEYNDNNVFVQVYDKNGNAVRNFEHFKKGWDGAVHFVFSRTLTVGQLYYIKVTPNPFEPSSGGYRIAFNKARNITTTSTGSLSFNIWGGSNLSSGSEYWFKFTPTSSGTLYIHAGFRTLKNIYVQLYNDDENTIGSRINLKDDGLKYTSYNNLTVGQEYYIKVQPASGSGSFSIAFNMSPTATPRYSLSTLLSNSQWTTTSLRYLDDSEQWYRFEATSASQYIHVSSVAAQISPIYVTLYDSNGENIGGSEPFSTTGGQKFFLRNNLNVGQLYYIKVNTGTIPSSDSGSYSYKIFFNASENSPSN